MQRNTHTEIKHIKLLKTESYLLYRSSKNSLSGNIIFTVGRVNSNTHSLLLMVCSIKTCMLSLSEGLII